MSTPRVRRRMTLRRRLVLGIAFVVAAVLVTVGIVSVVTLNASVTTVVDTQLSGSMSALRHSVEKLRNGTSGYGGASTGPGAGKPFVDYTGHGPGTIIAIEQNGVVTDSARFSESDAVALSSEVVARLEAASLTDETHQSLDLPSLGNYRLASETDSQGNVLIAGVSMATAEAAVRQETLVISVLAILGLLIIVIGAIVVVRLALRPLARVAETAVAVTSMPLDRGEVAITPRVAEADTDPRTEVGQVGEALNRLLAHVDDALAVRAATDTRMRRFVTDASHELRTPLAAIQGYAELTRQDAASLPEVTEYSLARIESEAKRMNSLVSDLLLLARLDEGQDLHLDEMDLADIALNAVSDANASWPDHRWMADVPDAPALVTGGRERMHQLVLNLLSNAAVHTPAGTSVTAGVRFAGAGAGAVGAGAAADGPRTAAGTPGPGAPGGVVELFVTDDGPGIAAELVPELFERFARGDSSRSRRAGSSGLGLAIVSSIVDNHGGTISVDSSPAGTTFTVRLARVISAPADTTSPTGDSPPAAAILH
ncbi:HAMP domain-containing sensor histidine kinase [Herbiconiux sp. 11R-BC]|uniref:sensor histidine kinase n=1 Tax=Herbiconiux sp. 11R-BC TaxID=3111637 RepID=UPI003C069979